MNGSTGYNSNSAIAAHGMAIPTMAELKAWKTDVVLKVVDESIEKSRELREAAEAQRAEREAQEAKQAAERERRNRDREEIEAEDARKLAMERAAQAREVAQLRANDPW